MKCYWMLSMKWPEGREFLPCSPDFNGISWGFNLNLDEKEAWDDMAQVFPCLSRPGRHRQDGSHQDAGGEKRMWKPLGTLNVSRKICQFLVRLRNPLRKYGLIPGELLFCRP